jgi:hypothetical protein
MLDMMVSRDRGSTDQFGSNYADSKLKKRSAFQRLVGASVVDAWTHCCGGAAAEDDDVL